MKEFPSFFRLMQNCNFSFFLLPIQEDQVSHVPFKGCSKVFIQLKRSKVISVSEKTWDRNVFRVLNWIEMKREGDTLTEKKTMESSNHLPWKIKKTPKNMSHLTVQIAPDKEKYVIKIETVNFRNFGQVSNVKAETFSQSWFVWQRSVLATHHPPTFSHSTILSTYLHNKYLGSKIPLWKCIVCLSVRLSVSTINLGRIQISTCGFH